MNFIIEILAFSFMRRALLAGNLIGIIAPLVGVFLNLRRLSLLGHTLSHVALAGVALGIYLGVYPIYSAIIISIIAALAVEKLRRDYQDYAELALAVVLATGLGLAVILISAAEQTAGVHSYLFGSISLVASRDIYTIIPLFFLILAVIARYYYGFFYLAFDEEEARLAGVPVGFLNTVFMIIVSITVALSIRIVGALLISSLITIPVATGMLIGSSFQRTVIISIAASMISVNLGLIFSFQLDIAPGGTIILVSVMLLAAVLSWQRLQE